MTFIELKKKRGFTIEQNFNGEYRLQFKHSDLKIARQGLKVIKELGASMVWQDVNGGKSVGGYYASGIITKDKATEIGLI